MFLLKRSLTQSHPSNDCEGKKEVKMKELREALGPLTGRSLKYCTDPCLRRYLEARDWDVKKSKKMLEESLKWRSTYKPEEIRWSEVADIAETGQAFKANFSDREGRTVLIQRPAMQGPNMVEGSEVKYLIYLLENGIMNLPAGQEQMSWIIDFTGFSFNTKMSMKTSRELVSTLQNHYPERLAVIFLYNPPTIFHVFYQALKYFIDQKTAQKVKFVFSKNKESVELMKTSFDVDRLPAEFGGKLSIKYDYEDFSKEMVRDDVKTAKLWGFNDKPAL